MGLLDGKVAIVTGAGTGVGRSEALELARQGATVVVNDLGVGLDGTGTPSDAPAHEVVSAIEADGGTATAHFGDVSDWDYTKALISEAAERYGDVHIVVNNAGILRDRMLFNMEEAEFDAVIRVHLKGHFNMVRHATAHWRQRAKDGHDVYGRIVNTTSEAALFASAGQPNYAAAKAGIIALTTAAAQAMVKYGVTANAIAPRARTRMTETAFPDMFKAPEEGFDVWSPDNVAPLVAYLASPQASRVTGQVFIVWGNQVTVLAGPAPAERFEAEGRWSAEALASALGPFYEGREPLAGYAMPPS